MMLRYRRQKWAVVLYMPLLLLAGCFGGGDQWTKDLPETVNASGVVLLNGQPVENATVVFAPVEPGTHPAKARTNKKGEFTADAFPSKGGAVPGTYQVAVSKTIETTMTYPAFNPGEDAEHAEAAGPTQGVGWKNVLPQQYANPFNSGLEVVIPPEGTKDIKIELKE
jgi:hypothetical protein